MPLDIPEGVGTTLLNQAVQTHQFLMTESQGNIQFANATLRAIGNKVFDQLDSVEAQANRALTNTPIGAPTTSAGNSSSGGA
jgi:hypothetical protein